jgi:hypothetical protein
VHNRNYFVQGPIPVYVASISSIASISLTNRQKAWEVPTNCKKAVIKPAGVELDVCRELERIVASMTATYFPKRTRSVKGLLGVIRIAV